MKTIKQIFRNILGILIISLCLTQLSIAQERKESFVKTYELNSTGDFSFSCYDTDLKVNTWEKNEVKLTGEIIIKGGKKEDQDELIYVFKNPEVSHSSNSLNIKTDIAESTIIIGPFKKITLVSGKVIRVDKFKATYTLWVPESVGFNLKSKYNNIEIANLKGEVNFELHDADLVLSEFNEGIFRIKYGSINIGKGNKALFDIYDSKFEIKEINRMSLESKYSEYDIEKVQIMVFKSYDDKFRIREISGMTGDAKYTDFNIESNMGILKSNLYDSKINAKNINKVTYTAKYSDLKALNVGSCEISSLYDSNIEFAKVDEFTCKESKYDDIIFESISKSVYMPNTYDSKLKVLKVKPSFESFEGEFKYGSVIMKLGPALDYSLNFEITHGSVNYSKEKFKLKNNDNSDSDTFLGGFISIKEGSTHTFKASTSANPKCKIKFTAYDTDFNFN